MAYTPRSALYVGHLLTTGEETFPRINIKDNSMTMTSGTLRLSYFTARKTESVNNIAVMTGGTAAGATPTLCRMGLYSVDASGNLTLVASTANDTTLFASNGTLYTKATSAAGATVAGQRYAIGVLVVTAAAAPTLAGWGSLAPSSAYGSGLAPRLMGAFGGQTDLPTPIAVGSVTDSTNWIWAMVKP